MSSRIIKALAALGALALLAAVAPGLTGELRRHLQRLWRHVEANREELSSNQEPLLAEIQSKYNSVSWRVHRVAGNKNSYPLSTKLQRRETLEKLGRGTTAEDVELNLDIDGLPDSYRSALADAVAALAVKASAGSRHSALAVFSGKLSSRRLELPMGPEYLSLLRESQAVLAALPTTSLLRSALWKLEFDAMSASAYRRPFLVNSDPPWDMDGAWSAHAVTTWTGSQTQRIRVQPRGASTEEIIAYATRAPRYVEVDLLRPWMSDQLLDELSQSPVLQVHRHFSSIDGRLHLIPAKLWVRLGDEVLLEAKSKEEVARLSDWAENGRCCRIILAGEQEETELLLDPMSLGRIRGGVFLGHEPDDAPLLWALVSRRRENGA